MSNHAELTRRLRDCDPQVRYAIMFLYENFMELSKQFDTMTHATVALAENMEGLVALNQQTQHDLHAIRSFGQTPGVQVESVTNDPDRER